MKIEELKRYALQELDCLRYYATEESRKNLNNNSSILKQLVAIGYSKTVMKLPNRCNCNWIILDQENPSIESANISIEQRDIENNIYNSVEAWLILYPETFDDMKRFLLDYRIREF